MVKISMENTWAMTGGNVLPHYVEGFNILLEYIENFIRSLSIYT